MHVTMRFLPEVLEHLEIQFNRSFSTTSKRPNLTLPHPNVHVLTKIELLRQMSFCGVYLALNMDDFDIGVHAVGDKGRHILPEYVQLGLVETILSTSTLAI